MRRCWPTSATGVGFYDQSALNKHFKRCYGITPTQFARAARGAVILAQFSPIPSDGRAAYAGRMHLFCHEQPETLTVQTDVADARPGKVALAQSPFYPGGGGQLADRGVIRWQGGEAKVVGLRGLRRQAVASARQPERSRRAASRRRSIPTSGA